MAATSALLRPAATTATGRSCVPANFSIRSCSLECLRSAVAVACRAGDAVEGEVDGLVEHCGGERNVTGL